MNILGVHIGHDSSAALLRDGHLVADVAEERARAAAARSEHAGDLGAPEAEFLDLDDRLVVVAGDEIAHVDRDLVLGFAHARG